MLTFWTDETIRLIRERFIAASVPTWVCRSETPEGEFLRGAGVHRQWVTSSGYLTCVSASGRPLGRQPSAQVLAEFEKLPAAERLPGAVKVPELPAAQRAIPEPPAGGLVLRVHARFLTRGEDGQLRAARPADFPLMRENPKVMRSWELFLHPNTEYLWLTAEERRGLVPAEPVPGARVTVDAAIALRLARFHLTPKRATTSEAGIVGRQLVRAAALEVVVTDATPERLRMSVGGFVHWGSDFDAAKATSPNGPLAMGFATPLHGRLEFDRRRGVFTRFDLVASGEVWGRWGDANGRSLYVERPGRSPFGFALELATGDSPSDRIPPGGNGRYVSDQSGYFGTAGTR